MDSLIIAPTEDTPEITMDPANGIFEMKGRALPEDAVAFFKPIHDWLENYLENSEGEVNFTIEFSYLNSSATRYIFNTLTLLEDAHEEGRATSLTWRYDKDDEVMEMKGEDLEEMLDFPVKLVTF